MNKGSPKRAPLWRLLVDRGLCANRKEAEACVLAGEVLVDNEPSGKAGVSVSIDADIRFRTPKSRYVSRGGDKLEAALGGFGILAYGRVVLDAGASTGGFTDCLLQHGARRVYAVDTGFGQLAGKLRSDDRVVNMERTNLGDIDPDELDEPPSLITLDLSYLSLRIGLPLARRLLAPGGEVVALVKPLFETSDSTARRTGRIVSRDDFAEVLLGLADFAIVYGYSVAGMLESPVRGGHGTIEFFLHLETDESAEAVDVSAAIEVMLASLADV